MLKTFRNNGITQFFNVGTSQRCSFSVFFFHYNLTSHDTGFFKLNKPPTHFPLEIHFELAGISIGPLELVHLVLVLVLAGQSFTGEDEKLPLTKLPLTKH